VTQLVEVTGAYRVYLGEIGKSTVQGFCWKLRPALTLAISLAKDTGKEAFVTEEMDAGKTTRIYHIPKGGGLPELVAEPPPYVPETKNGRALELEVG
jgi:hypothetical protein